MTACNDPGLRFSVGQNWVNKDTRDGRFFSEVMETSNQGRRGTVVITDDQGNVVDAFSGTAAAFQGSGEWQLMYDWAFIAGLRKQLSRK